MMSPQSYERLVQWRQEQLLQEAAAERLAARVYPRRTSLRGRAAVGLYRLAAWLGAGVADARGAAAIRAIATCDGVEYWRPLAPVPR